RPRFQNHAQPKTPLWGYEDEADPQVMARKIDAAANHGLSGFIFDWYSYNDGPFLERALEEGFLNAPNNDRLKFALMWANHDWVDIHPAQAGTAPALLYPGKVTPETFKQITELCIERYFRHPSYWKLDGCPYFSVYELMTLVDGLGGIEPAREALEQFRAKTKRAGFPDLHLNAVVWGVQILPNETAVKNPQELMQKLGFNSVGSYVWIHHTHLPEFPQTSYQWCQSRNQDYWQQAQDEFSVPYFPNVTMGWDASPRCRQSDEFQNLGYPFMSILEGNTPQNFEAALQNAKEFLEASAAPRILTLNAWNEWTEGSYLEPDSHQGYGYLEAIRRVFGQQS
ncbi:MAG: glycoside hydrolase family 99-like domain-containing protein, partial [Abditibacteriaceae bacterium]